MIFLQYPIVFLIVVCSRYSLYLTTLGVRNGTFLNCLNLIDSVSYYPPTHTHTHTTPPPHTHFLSANRSQRGQEELYLSQVSAVMFFIISPINLATLLGECEGRINKWKKGSSFTFISYESTKASISWFCANQNTGRGKKWSDLRPIFQYLTSKL